MDNQAITGTGGAKFDAGKVRMDLVPPEFTFAVAGALTYGAHKYEDWNWAKGMRKGRLIAALMRHANLYLAGEELDVESGLPHTWHIGACTAVLIGCEMRGVAEDDRAEAVEAMRKVEKLFAGMLNPNAPAMAEKKESFDKPSPQQAFVDVAAIKTAALKTGPHSQNIQNY